MTRVGIAGIGVVSPGGNSWAENRVRLKDNQDCHAMEPIPRQKCELLSSNERRRTTSLIQMVLQCGRDATAESKIKSDSMPTVFACSCGDLEVVDKILDALALPEKPVSPIHFHNSVHNAPGGYWSMATGCLESTTSITAHDSSFSAGLLEAVAQVIEFGKPVLLVAYDGEVPENLNPFRPRVNAFSVGLVITADPAPIQIEVAITDEGPVSAMDATGWEMLRSGNPAANALPLLEKIAREESAEIYLPYVSGNRLQVKLEVSAA